MLDGSIPWSIAVISAAWSASVRRRSARRTCRAPRRPRSVAADVTRDHRGDAGPASLASKADPPCPRTRSSCGLRPPRRSARCPSISGNSPNEQLQPLIVVQPSATMKLQRLLGLYYLLALARADADSPRT